MDSISNMLEAANLALKNILFSYALRRQMNVFVLSFFKYIFQLPQLLSPLLSANVDNTQELI